MMKKRRKSGGWGLSRRRRRDGGFSLVEAMVAATIVTMCSIGMMTSLVMARELAEYDKQRIAAISAARTFLEERTRRNLFPTLTPVDNVTLDNFNTPDVEDDLQAEVELQMFEVNPDGSKGAELFVSPSTAQRIMLVVTVSWNRTVNGRRVSESLASYVSPDA